MTIPIALFVVLGAGFGAIVGLGVGVAVFDDLEQRAWSRARALCAALGFGAATVAYFIVFSVAAGIAEYGAR